MPGASPPALLLSRPAPPPQSEGSEAKGEASSPSPGPSRRRSGHRQEPGGGGRRLAVPSLAQRGRAGPANRPTYGGIPRQSHGGEPGGHSCPRRQRKSTGNAGASSILLHRDHRCSGPLGCISPAPSRPRTVPRPLRGPGFDVPGVACNGCTSGPRPVQRRHPGLPAPSWPWTGGPVLRIYRPQAAIWRRSAVTVLHGRRFDGSSRQPFIIPDHPGTGPRGEPLHGTCRLLDPGHGSADRRPGAASLGRAARFAGRSAWRPDRHLALPRGARRASPLIRLAFPSRTILRFRPRARAPFSGTRMLPRPPGWGRDLS